MRRYAALRILLHDRATTAGAVIGVVSIIFLVGQQLAVLFGLFTYMSALVDHSGADVWIVSKNTDNINSTGSLPMHYIDRLQGIAGIEWVEPLVNGGGLLKRADGSFQPVAVVGLPTPRLTAGPWRFAEGSLDVLYDGENVVVDKLDAKVLGKPRVGDWFEISGKAVRVGGISFGARGFGATFVFASLAKARQVSGLPADRCSYILVKLRPGTDRAAMLALIRSVLPRGEPIPTGVLSARTRLYYVANTGIGSSIGFSTLVGALVGVIIITLTMYTMVVNRQREFAVLRALGARRRDVTLIVLFQALIIGLLGSLCGFLLMAGFLAGTRDSGLPASVPGWFGPLQFVATLLLCLLGSLLAVRRATKIEPAAAFR